MHKTPIVLHNVDGRDKLNFPPTLLDDVVSAAYRYLQDSGWFNDCPSDSEGYTPWYTYPAITFLKDIIDPKHKVLEYGSGYSSLYYKDKVADVCSVEHDLEWAQKITDKHSNLQIHVVEENSAVHIDAKDSIENFLKSVRQWRSNHREHDVKHGLVNNEFAGYASMIYMKPKGYYDIVVVDGMARALCAWVAADMVADDGYIILDNSDRCQYNNIHEFLTEKGYGRIDFWGIGYGQYEQFCTSFFSKNFKVKNNKLLRPDKPGPINT